MTTSRTILTVLVAIVAGSAVWLLFPIRRSADTPGALPPPSTTLPHLLRKVRYISPEDPFSTNNSSRQVSETATNTDRLTRAEIEAYLTKKGRSAENLIAAYYLANDTDFLKEAARKYQADPRVQFHVLGANLFPEDRRLWLEAFKKSAPDNALANYLTAREDFKAGQTAEALAELADAQGKPSIDLYWPDNAQAVAEAYIAAGFASPDAHLESLGYSFPPPNVMIELRGLTVDITAYATSSRQDGDTATADTLITAGLTLGKRLSTGDAGKLVIDQLVGSAIQMITLKSVDSSTPIEFADSTQTAAERLAAFRWDEMQLRMFTATILPARSSPP